MGKRPHLTRGWLETRGGGQVKVERASEQSRDDEKGEGEDGWTRLIVCVVLGAGEDEESLGREKGKEREHSRGIECHVTAETASGSREGEPRPFLVH